MLAQGEQAHEEGQEGREAKFEIIPGTPKSEVVDAHLAAAHIPFRTWCKHCVAGQAVDDAHRKLGDKDREVPVISMDYCYMYESMAERRKRKAEEQKGVRGRRGTCRRL